MGRAARQLSEDKSLTDDAWFKFDDIIPAWRSADSVDGKLYGVPYDGEVTIQVYRKDLYDAKGLKPADTLEAYVANAAALNNPGDRIWGTALRGVAGAGQNMYIYPSIFREFGGNWMKDGKLTVNGPEAEAALAWYVDADAQICAGGGVELELARYRGRLLARHGGELHRRAFLGFGRQQSRKIQGNRQGRLCALAQGPVRQARDLDLELGFSDQRGASDKKKKATWLFIQWAASAETQARTAHRFAGPTKRSGVNRTSIWKDPDYVKLMNGFGDNFVEATMQALQEDTDVDWRPRVPQWPAVGDTMATAIQSALPARPR